MTALCFGRPEEWWWTGDDGNRLALMLCARCQGCPTEDPKPHGVIREGLAYSDTGRVLPSCPGCGYPDTGYRGGTVVACPRCAVPDVPIPSDRGNDRLTRIRELVSAGVSDEVIAAELGMAPDSLRKLRCRNGIRRRTGPRSSTEPATESLGGAFVDEARVERALEGERLDLSDAELVSALQAGTARKVPLTVLSERLGINHVAARRLLNHGVPPRKARHAAAVAALRADPHRANSVIAAEVGLSEETVRRARLRLTAEAAA